MPIVCAQCGKVLKPGDEVQGYVIGTISEDGYYEPFPINVNRFPFFCRKCAGEDKLLTGKIPKE